MVIAQVSATLPVSQTDPWQAKLVSVDQQGGDEEGGNDEGGEDESKLGVCGRKTCCVKIKEHMFSISIHVVKVVKHIEMKLCNEVTLHHTPSAAAITFISD